MICVLCYESNKDSIRLISSEGKQHRVSSLLFKYFQFCFEVRETANCFNGFQLQLSYIVPQKEPTDGDLCRDCWQKMVLFHEFYMRIEYIYETTSKDRIVSSILKVKEENVEEIRCEQIDGINDSESSLKSEPVFLQDSADGIVNSIVTPLYYTTWSHSK